MTGAAADGWAIQQLMNRYSEGACRRDWAQMLDTFAQDGVWAVPSRGMELTGHAEIGAELPVFVGQFDYFVQMNSAAVIDVSGDRATARSVIRECGRFSGRDEALEVMGRYDDELVRTNAGWKFARRTFTAYGLHRFPLLAGPAF